MHSSGRTSIAGPSILIHTTRTHPYQQTEKPALVSAAPVLPHAPHALKRVCWKVCPRRCVYSCILVELLLLSTCTRRIYLCVHTVSQALRSRPQSSPSSSPTPMSNISSAQPLRRSTNIPAFGADNKQMRDVCRR